MTVALANPLAPLDAMIIRPGFLARTQTELACEKPFTTFEGSREDGLRNVPYATDGFREVVMLMVRLPPSAEGRIPSGLRTGRW